METHRPIAVCPKQAAFICGISRAQLYALWQRGEGPARIKAGGRTLVRLNAIDVWLDQQQVKVRRAR